MVAGPKTRADDQPLPYAGMTCPACRYNLTGTTTRRCPECGEAFDPRALRSKASWWWGRPGRWATLVVVCLAAYLPNTWVFWIDYPWGGGYRMQWVKMFAVLPAFVPGAWCYRFLGLPNDFDRFWGVALLGVVCVCLIGVCYWIGRRSRLALLVTGAVVLALEVFNALVSYALFRM